MRPRISCDTAGRPVRCRLFQVQNKRKPRRCQAMTVSGFTMCTAQRQHRFTTPSWGRRAMISLCSETRDRATHRRNGAGRGRTEATTGGYRTWAVTSIDVTRTELSVATGVRSGPKILIRPPLARATVQLVVAAWSSWSGCSNWSECFPSGFGRAFPRTRKVLR